MYREAVLVAALGDAEVALHPLYLIEVLLPPANT